MALFAILSGSDAIGFLPREWAEAEMTRALLQKIQVSQGITGPKTCLIRRCAAPLTRAAEALAGAPCREVTYYLS